MKTGFDKKTRSIQAGSRKFISYEKYVYILHVRPCKMIFESRYPLGLNKGHGRFPFLEKYYKSCKLIKQ